MFLFLVLFLFTENYLCAQSNDSFSQSGEWIKIRVRKSGIYKLSYDYLKRAGISKPELAVVIGRGGSFSDMFNKENIPEMTFMPTYCDKGKDGKFGKGDFYLLYAKGPEDITYDDTTGKFFHKKNQYEDFATYFVGYGNLKKQTIQQQEYTFGATYTDVYNSDFFIYHEKSLRNLLKSGRNPVGEKFSSTIEYLFEIDIPDIAMDEELILRYSLLARGVTNSEFEIIFNDNLLGTFICNKVNVVSFSSPFADVKIFESRVLGKERNRLKIGFKREGSNVGWLDYFTVQARKKLKLHNGELLFSDSETAATNKIIRFNIQADEKLKVWDITNLDNVIEMNVTNNSDKNFVVVRADKYRQFIAFDPKFDFKEPELIGKIENSNLHGISDIEMLIVTVSELKTGAERLADFHNNEGLKTKVVLAEDVYNEFSSGQKHPIGIRDFIRHIYMKSLDSEVRLKYLCLFGDGSYDADKSLLATWQTSNYIEPSNSFLSDDFFGLLDEGEGESIGDLDIGIGRIPVNTELEASIVVDKINTYKYSNPGSWITRLAMIADDGDYNEHVSNTDIIAEMIDENNPGYRVEKIYMDGYIRQNDFGKYYYPEVNRELSRLINDGVFICNYIGHGNEKGLAHEKILTEEDIAHWKNKEKLPLFITATCDFSRFDDHNQLSAGEKIFLKENGGAIALLSTTRLVYSSPNFLLNKEIFKHILSKNVYGEHYRLGDLIRTTKNKTNAGESIRNFLLIGDPALLLNYPEGKVKLLSISDTIKAYGKMEIKGEICTEDGERDEDFEGVVDIAVFDKKNEINTLGNNSDPFKYFYRNNIIFKGTASVREGKFFCDFPGSADIGSKNGYGKIYFYAYNDYYDAFGYNDTISVGGKAFSNEEDNVGPNIDLYINNEKFIYGGITDNNPLLFARLFDNSGINMFGYYGNHSIVATLDGEISIVLNQNYISDIDDFSRGTVWYRFSNLSEGFHSVILDVWDNYNNHSSKEISFHVKDENSNIIKSLRNYPNPAILYTDFYFEHNMPDQSLHGNINIYNISGQLVKTIRFEGIDQGYRYGPFRWYLDNERGEKVRSGIYIAELLLRNAKGKIIKSSQKVVVRAY